MIYLGIDTQSFLIYEGRSKHGARALWPEPILSPTAFGLASNSTLPSVPFDSWHAAKYLFREDSYDPASKIRRGRFYIQEATQPDYSSWRILIAPPVRANPTEVDIYEPDLAKKAAYSYQSYMLTTELQKASEDQLLVVIVLVAMKR